MKEEGREGRGGKVGKGGEGRGGRKRRKELGFISSLSLGGLDCKMKGLKKRISSNVIMLTLNPPLRRKKQRGLGESSCYELRKVRLNPSVCGLGRVATHPKTW